MSSRPNYKKRRDANKKTTFRSKKVDTDDVRFVNADILLLAQPTLYEDAEFFDGEVSDGENTLERSEFYKHEQDLKNLPKIPASFFDKEHRDVDKAYNYGLDAESTQNLHARLLELERIKNLPQCTHDKEYCDCELISYHFYNNYHTFNSHVEELIMSAPEKTVKLLKKVLKRSLKLVKSSTATAADFVQNSVFFSSF